MTPGRPAPAGLRSAVYEGTLLHRRFGPGPEHSFRYRVAMRCSTWTRWRRSPPGTRCRRTATPHRCASLGATSWGTRPSPWTTPCATWSSAAPGAGRRARWPSWPTCAPGAGCSTRSACTSAPTPTGGPADHRWWPRSRTPRGTSGPPTWSAGPGSTGSPRPSTCRPSSPWTSTTGCATARPGRGWTSRSTCSTVRQRLLHRPAVPAPPPARPGRPRSAAVVQPARHPSGIRRHLPAGGPAAPAGAPFFSHPSKPLSPCPAAPAGSSTAPARPIGGPP